MHGLRQLLPQLPRELGRSERHPSGRGAAGRRGGAPMSTFLTAEHPVASPNLYLPELMEVLSVRQETSDVKSVKVRFKDAGRQQSFEYRVGQFGLWSPTLRSA